MAGRVELVDLTVDDRVAIEVTVAQLRQRLRLHQRIREHRAPAAGQFDVVVMIDRIGDGVLGELLRQQVAGEVGQPVAAGGADSERVAQQRGVRQPPVRQPLEIDHVDVGALEPHRCPTFVEDRRERAERDLPESERRQVPPRCRRPGAVDVEWREVGRNASEERRESSRAADEIDGGESLRRSDDVDVSGRV